jgi:excisionase family DNA binding protein
MPPIERLVVSVPEAAQMMGVSTSTAYRLARENQIPVIRIGSSVRVNLRQLERWIEEHTSAA